MKPQEVLKALRRKVETGHTVAISARKLHAALQLPGCHMFMCFTIMCIVMSWWAHLPDKMKLNHRGKRLTAATGYRIGVNL